MVRTDISVKTAVVISLNNFKNVKRACHSFLCRLLKASLARDFNVAYVREMHAVAKRAHHIGNIVVWVGAERAAAKCQTVIFAVIKF